MLHELRQCAVDILGDDFHRAGHLVEVTVRDAVGSGGEVALRQFDDHILEMCRQQVVGGTVRDDFAMVHDGDFIAQIVRLLHVMRGQQHGLVARLDAVDQFPEIQPRLRVKAGGGFVEEHHVRVIHQRQRQQHALALAAGQLAGVTVEVFTQAANVHQFLQRQAAGVQAAEELEVFAHGEEILQRRRLELDARLIAETRALRFTLVQDVAGGGFGDALHHFNGGGLARPVGPQQAEADALAHGEIHAIDGFDAGIMLAQVADFENRNAHVHAVSDG